MIGKFSSMLRDCSLPLASMAALSLAPYSPIWAAEFPKHAGEMTVLFERTNITTLTDLVVAKAMAGDPALAFGDFDAAKANAIKVGPDAAQVCINASVSAIVGKSMMTGMVSIKSGG